MQHINRLVESVSATYAEPAYITAPLCMQRGGAAERQLLHAIHRLVVSVSATYTQPAYIAAPLCMQL